MSLNQLIDSRDVRFTLFEMLELEKLNRFDAFKDFDRSVYEDTLELAEKILAAQEPEINTMSGWLESWDEEVPSDDGAMDGMDHGSSSSSDMPGMMSEEEMASLENAIGDDFVQQRRRRFPARHDAYGRED